MRNLFRKSKFVALDGLIKFNAADIPLCTQNNSLMIAYLHKYTLPSNVIRKTQYRHNFHFKTVFMEQLSTSCVI